MGSPRMPRSTSWRFAAGAVLCLVLGWFAFVRGVRVPLLGLVDLGFHELGHLVTAAFPHVLTALAGSLAQVGVPLGLAVYFATRAMDGLGAGLCLAWAGTSARDVAVYIADAPFQGLQLIGGEHDWAFLLGRWDLLHRADGIATVVSGLGLLLVLAGLAVCVAGLARAWRPPAPVRAPSPAVGGGGGFACGPLNARDPRR